MSEEPWTIAEADGVVAKIGPETCSAISRLFGLNLK